MAVVQPGEIVVVEKLDRHGLLAIPRSLFVACYDRETDALYLERLSSKALNALDPDKAAAVSRELQAHDLTPKPGDPPKD